ncbi:MAG: hypothetical protein ABSF71_05645 [Terriglobia bacterium]|jgi:hypothetical protein
MKTSLKYFSLWLPLIYAVVVSGIALFGWSQSTISLPPGFPAFLAFLPIAFLFVAANSQSHISRLERRIESLEKQAGARTGEISS